MNRIKMAVLAGILTLAPQNMVRAHQLDDVLIESWTGTGDHTALLVVDFWPGDGDANSFAFGYHFSADQITGLELLNALHAADNGFTYAAVGDFVTDFWYVIDETTYHAGYVWPDSYWSYWLSSDFGETWDYSMVGPASRILTDGDTDGWLAKYGYDEQSEPITPLAPELMIGDMNCDEALNAFDIDPFVVALTDPAAYEAAYPDCDRSAGDINEDGELNAFDIDPFVNLLTS